MKNALVGLIALFVSSAVVPAANASLIGDTITANLLVSDSVIDTVTELVLAGPETTGNWFGQIAYNVEADTLTVSSLLSRAQNPNTFWLDSMAFNFLDLDWPGNVDGRIIGASITSATGAGWSLIGNSALSFTDHGVFIDAAAIGSTQVELDQRIVISVQTLHPIPVPGSLSLFCLALAGLGGRRR